MAAWVVGYVIFLKELTRFDYQALVTSPLAYFANDLKLAFVVYLPLAVLLMFWERWAVWKNNQLKGR